MGATPEAFQIARSRLLVAFRELLDESDVDEVRALLGSCPDTRKVAEALHVLDMHQTERKVAEAFDLDWCGRG